MNNKLLSKNYISLVISATLFYTASFMINAVCSRYAVDIGASKTTAGFTAAAFTLSSFFTRPIWGYFSDKKGRKQIYIAGGMLCLVATAVLFFTKTIPLLFVARILFGGGYSAITTAGGTMVCDIVSPEKLKQAIAFYGVTNVLSQAVAPAVALYIFEFGFVWVAATAAVAVILVLIFAFFVKYPQQDFINPQTSFRIFEKTALPAAYTIFFFAISTSAVNSFIPVMAEERNLGQDGWFFILSAIFLFIARAVNTPLSKKTGEKRVFYIGDVIYIVAFMLMAFSYGNLLLLLSATFYGTGAGFIHPIVNTAAVKRCKSGDRGLATGTFMMSQDLGMTIGAVLWGFISDKSGFTAVYLGTAVVILVMMVVFKKVMADLLE